MLPFMLLGVGLLLIFLEFFLPGGIMGTLGALVVISSVVVFAMQYGSLALLMFYAIACIGLVILLFRFVLWRIRRGVLGTTFYSEDAQEGFTASNFDGSAIGKEGIVDTDLKPGGHIIVDGKRHAAISLSGYVAKGEKIKVTGGQGESLTVKKIKE